MYTVLQFVVLVCQLLLCLSVLLNIVHIAKHHVYCTCNCGMNCLLLFLLHLYVQINFNEYLVSVQLAVVHTKSETTPTFSSSQVRIV